MSLAVVGSLQRAESYWGVKGPLFRLDTQAERLSFVPRSPLHHVLARQLVDRADVRWVAAARHFPESGIIVMLTNGNRWVFRTRVDVGALLNKLGALGYQVADEA